MLGPRTGELKACHSGPVSPRLPEAMTRSVRDARSRRSSVMKRLLKAAVAPSDVLFYLWKRSGLGSYKARLDLDLVDRPHYAFCVYQAALAASALGIPRVSLIEFGVAGGRGLLCLEETAHEIEQLLGVRFEIYGFDTGTGLPEPVDYRDLPYIWKPGFFRMDVKALKSRLTRSRLVLGDVAETVNGFFSRYDAPPLGAVFFDLDYWSSTKSALDIFRCEDSCILPRVYCYFDDILSGENGGVLNSYVGQPLAIREYNRENETKKIAAVDGLRFLRFRPMPWNEKIFVHHSFLHKDYCTYVHPESDRQLSI